ncbi:MAG: DNA-directed RNA polymerase subunit delta [Coprobacillus sp.]|nr:DNA-directed RNA polymerase subunit delta [Coprobacillus sp.]
MNELDVAYDYLLNVSKGETPFSKIWEYVKEKCEMTNEEANSRIAQFFTNFQLDGRFVTVGENVWDLRERQTFDKVHIDMRDVYNDVEDTDKDEEDEEEVAYDMMGMDEEEIDLEEDSDDNSGDEDEVSYDVDETSDDDSIDFYN